MPFIPLVFFAVVWSGLVLLFDGVVAHDAYKQFVSSHYPTTNGIVTASTVEVHHGSKGGVSYVPAISYCFTVNGQTYNGNRIRYSSGFSSGPANAHNLVSAHPVNSSITVHYNPSNPEDAVLFPGVEGGDVIVGLFLTPFNMVMLALWTWMGGWLKERLFRPVAGGVKIITNGMITRVHLPQYAAIWWGLGTAGVLGFIAVFIVGFSTDMHPSIPVALSTIAAVYLAGGCVYFWHQLKINTGIDDLVIHEGERTLDLPATFGRDAQMTVNLSDVGVIVVQKLIHRSSKGGISYTYAPTLTLRGPNAGIHKLAEWYDQRKAQDFAGWLSQKVNIQLCAPEL